MAEDECLLEIGSSQTYDAGSTGYLAEAARHYGRLLYSIDVDQDASKRAHDAGAIAYHDNAEHILWRWQIPPFPWVRFAWIDGWDWPYSWLTPEHRNWAVQQAKYAALGMEITEEASARSHLIIAKHLHDITHDKSLVIFDDTWLGTESNPGWHGKGQSGVPWLLRHDCWHLIATVDGIEPEDGFVALQRKEV